MAKWICTICSYEHEGEQPPDKCPKCGASSQVFVFGGLGKQGKEPPKDSVTMPENLEEVRNRARQRMKGICAVYPYCNGRDDRICQREAYGKPIGMGGVGTGMAFAANIQALENVKLRTAVVGEHFEPDLSLTFLGKELSMPVMGAPTSGVGRYGEALSELDFCKSTVMGCLEAGTMSWRGETFFYTAEDHPGLDALEEEGGEGIQIFKPREQDTLKKLIERAVKAGCPAVGVDLDGFGSTNMARGGQPVYRKSAKDIRELVAFAAVPFITKGIMTPDDAEACAEAGAAVIGVSNHGGRVLDSTPGVADVLPRVAERIKSRALITADGGVRTGFDVIKMLALGADAVLVGRDIIRAAFGGGAVGVKMHMDRLAATLRRAMLMTGCPDLASINADILET